MLITAGRLSLQSLQRPRAGRLPLCFVDQTLDFALAFVLGKRVLWIMNPFACEFLTINQFSWFTNGLIVFRLITHYPTSHYAQTRLIMSNWSFHQSCDRQRCNTPNTCCNTPKLGTQRAIKYISVPIVTDGPFLRFNGTPRSQEHLRLHSAIIDGPRRD
jgi:hypothetical protein